MLCVSLRGLVNALSNVAEIDAFYTIVSIFTALKIMYEKRNEKRLNQKKQDEFSAKDVGKELLKIRKTFKVYEIM